MPHSTSTADLTHGITDSQVVEAAESKLRPHPLPLVVWLHTVITFSVVLVVIASLTTDLQPCSLQPVSTFTSSSHLGDIKRGPHDCHQAASFAHNYTLPWQDILRTRLANIQKYEHPHDTAGVDRRSNLSLQEFWDVYDGKWPVLITDVVPGWPAYNWTSEFFLEHYGQERVVTKVVDDLWDTIIADLFTNDLEQVTHDHGTLRSSSPSKFSLGHPVTLALTMELFHSRIHQGSPQQWTYIEDELFIQTHPELLSDIGHSIYIEDDLFMEFPESVRPWNSMLLWGSSHSRSTLHIDPYNWTGTNAVLRGRKKWKLYHPGQDHLLHIEKGQMSGFPLDCVKYNSAVDAFDHDPDVHPNFAEADVISFKQAAGELLIIPPGWFHQAYNTEETLAISSQMMNHHNYRAVLEEIIKAGNVDRAELSDDLHHDTPERQVRHLISHLPEEILARGDDITRRLIRQRNQMNNQ